MESSSCIFYELQLQNAVNKNQASSCIHYTSTLIFPSCEGMQEGCMQTAYQTSNLHTQLCISRVSVNIQQDSWIAVPPCIIGTISNKSLFLGWKQCINIANTCLLSSQTAKVLNSTSLLNPFHRDALCSTGWSLHSHSSPGVVFSSAVSLKINKNHCLPSQKRTQALWWWITATAHGRCYEPKCGVSTGLEPEMPGTSEGHFLHPWKPNVLSDHKLISPSTFPTGCIYHLKS